MGAFLTHQMIAVLFLALIPLPIIALIRSRNGTTLESAKFWKMLVMLANIALIVTLITGFILFPDFTSIRVWVSVLLVLMIGAFLGIFSKRLKLYQLENDEEKKKGHLQKIAKVGFVYIVVVIGTFLFMSNWNNFS